MKSSEDVTKMDVTIVQYFIDPPNGSYREKLIVVKGHLTEEEAVDVVAFKFIDPNYPVRTRYGAKWTKHTQIVKS
jgi:hypothetical protein